MPQLYTSGVYRCRKSSELDEILVHNVNTGYNLGLQTGFLLGVFVSVVFVLATVRLKKN